MIADKKSTTGKPAVLAALLFVLITFATFLIENYDTIKKVKLANTDRELTHIAVFSAEQGRAYTGAFSHHKFRHPGPFHFYYLAGIKKMLGSSANQHADFRFGMVFFWLIASLLSVWLISRLSLGSSITLLLIPLLLLVLRNYDRDILTDYWNPHFTVPAFLVLLLSSAEAMNSGRVWMLFIAAISGSIVCQAHVGPTLCVLGILAVTTIHLLRARKLSVSGALLVIVGALLLWSPPLYEALAKSNSGWGNLGTLYQYFTSAPGAKNPWNAIPRVLSFFASPFDLRANWTITYILVGFLTLFPFLVMKSAGPSYPTGLKNLQLLSVVALFISFISASRIAGGFQQYLLCFLFALVCLMLLVNLFSLAKLFEDKLKRVSPSLQGAFIITLAIGLSYYAFPSKLPLTKSRESKLAGEVIEKLNLIPRTNLYRISFSDREVYPFVSHLFYHLLPEQIELCVSREWEYLFGETFECEGRGKLFSLPNYQSTIDLRVELASRASPATDGKRQVLIRKYAITTTSAK